MSLSSPPPHFHLPNAVVLHHTPRRHQTPFPLSPKPYTLLRAPAPAEAHRLPPPLPLPLPEIRLHLPRSSGGGGGGNEEDAEGEELGPLLRLEEVMKETEAKGVELPLDMIEAAKTTGLRKEFLLGYMALQGSAWPLGWLMKYCSMLRNRMLADPSFLFKVGTELQQACAALPSSVFEVERPGCGFSMKQRVASFFYKGVVYGSVGFVCGIIGQGIANLIMNAKRSIKKSEEGVAVPPLVKSAALWGVFLAISSNTRSQVVNGLEGLVEASPMAKHVPPIAMAFTIGV